MQTLNRRMRKAKEEAVKEQARYLGAQYQDEGRWTGEQAVNFQVAIGDLVDSGYFYKAKHSVERWKQQPSVLSYDRWITDIKRILNQGGSK